MNFFQKKINKCEEYHNGECDIKINNELYSLKKINGKSTLALDWSKNNTKNKKETFTHNISKLGIVLISIFLISPSGLKL